MKMNRKIAGLVVCLLLLISMLAVWVGQQAEEGKVEVLQRNELVLAIGDERDEGFDPTTGWGRYGSPLFHSTLLTRDNYLNVVNDLATSYEISDDGLTWTSRYVMM